MFSSGSNSPKKPAGDGSKRALNGSSPPSSSSRPIPSSTAQSSSNPRASIGGGYRDEERRASNARPRLSSSSSSPPPHRLSSQRPPIASSSSRPSQTTTSSTQHRTQQPINAVASSSKPTLHRPNPSFVPPPKQNAPIEISDSDSDDNQPTFVQKKAPPPRRPSQPQEKVTISLLSEDDDDDDEEPKLVSSTQKRPIPAAQVHPQASGIKPPGSGMSSEAGGAGMFWNGAGGDKRKREEPPARRGVSGTGPRRRPPTSSDEDSAPRHRHQMAKARSVKAVVPKDVEVIELSDSDDDQPPVKKTKVAAPAPAPAPAPILGGVRQPLTSSPKKELPTQKLPHRSPSKQVSPLPAQPLAPTSSDPTLVSKPTPSKPISLAASPPNATAGPSRQRVESPISLLSSPPVSVKNLPTPSHQQPPPSSSSSSSLAPSKGAASPPLDLTGSSSPINVGEDGPSDSPTKKEGGSAAVTKDPSPPAGSSPPVASKPIDGAPEPVRSKSPMDVDGSNGPEVVASPSRIVSPSSRQEAPPSAPSGAPVVRPCSPPSSLRASPLPAGPSNSPPEAGPSNTVAAPKLLSLVAQGKQREVFVPASPGSRRTPTTTTRDPSEPALEVVKKEKSRSPSKSKEPSPVVAAQVVASLSPAPEASTNSARAEGSPVQVFEWSPSKQRSRSSSQHLDLPQPEASTSTTEESKSRPWAKESDAMEATLIVSSPAKVKSPSPDSSDSEPSEPSPPPTQTQKARKRPSNGAQGLTTARKTELLAAQRSSSSSDSSPPPPQVDAPPAPPHKSASPAPPSPPPQALSIPSPSPAQSGPSNPSVHPDEEDDDASEEDDFNIDDLLNGIAPPSPAAASDNSDAPELLALLREAEEVEEVDEVETDDAVSLKADSRKDEHEHEEEDDDDDDDDGDLYLQALDSIDLEEMGREEEAPPDLRTTFQSLPLDLDGSLPDLPAEPIPAAVAELMNRQPRWVYLSSPKNTKEIFEAMILEASAETELVAPPPIKVSNEIDPHLEPCPKFEFGYVNRYVYGKNVPRPKRGVGCGCVGLCDPRSTTCQCALKQKSLNPDERVGFAYDETGRLRHINTAIVECCEDCECDEECMNRVAQRGRTFDVEIFKTLEKGWGVRANEVIPADRFLAIYAGVRPLLSPCSSHRLRR
ncbi:hypothetical protein BDY24DRAFT_172561 [Mrakia frigida]|uniref:uncharacterized protein n=1 Tax=Mrakia frigida TaxID=29902 RepID=UPI003FCC1E17